MPVPSAPTAEQPQGYIVVLKSSYKGSAATNAGAIAGVDWVTGHHVAGAPAVANMSLGGSASTALDNAITNSIADGVTYAVAAGNGNSFGFGFVVNACNTSPARVVNALTISATDITDRKASWANYGSCVDWFAPGVSITSACSNGLDDDGDFLVDFPADPGCTGATDTSEVNSPPPPPPPRRR